ncbi:MAG: class I SAM-dependent methyltransferase [Sedimentisphaerales bacterium]|nr:class I SAM-dependent methyltransferase [Sedimentisphaerales bacterium]
MNIKFPDDIHWRYWVECWDSMQERYIACRKERFELIVRLIADTQNTITRVLDIGCGTGSLMLSVLQKFLQTEVYGIDFDPTLLVLAEKRLAKFGRQVHFTQTDLRAESWLQSVPVPIDAAISATALHWLNAEHLSQLYCQLAGILRPGGIFLNADHLCSSSPAIQTGWEKHREQMLREQKDGDAYDWDGFWQAYGRALNVDINQFRSKFTWEGSEEGLPIEWHFEKLRACGFEAVDCFWRCDCDAIYGAIRGQN